MVVYVRQVTEWSQKGSRMPSAMVPWLFLIRLCSSSGCGIWAERASLWGTVLMVSDDEIRRNHT